ncbi:hypothetical protein AV654_29175 [Paenibacillus elgii]|uniref:Uncharacterized protein n=1 Tax=Paenibacillus elgii TaxID=189691 RepID=A0A163V5G1_9BACL|nr:hypothetical protein [Paenibacillus elgii]KZE74366.1 hypothetical protein AV654_29175 [Paenibacillus elgii]
MSIILRVQRESGGQPIEIGNGQITDYSYTNTSPSDFLAKAYNAEHSIQIRGEIPLRLLPPVEQDADNSNMLYAWALTEYRPDNDYYRSVTVQIVRHEKTIREVTFTHAYVHVYQEQVNGLKGVLEFELVVRQRRDQLDSIQFGSVEKIRENEKRVSILSNASKIEYWEQFDDYYGSTTEIHPINKDSIGRASYIFYEPTDWSDQAKSEADKLSKIYGSPVHMISISNINDFVSGWNSMGIDGESKVNIDGVSLLFHGHPTTVIIHYDEENPQYLTTNPKGKTDESGTPAYYIGKLDTKTIDQLYVWTCNGGNIDYLKNNTAVAFAKNNEIKTVIGWDGELSWTKLLDGTYTPRRSLNQHDFFKRWSKSLRMPIGEITYTKDIKGIVWPYWDTPGS